MIKVKATTIIGEINEGIEIESDKIDDGLFDVLNFLNIPRRFEVTTQELNTKEFWEEEMLKRQQRNGDE